VPLGSPVLTPDPLKAAPDDGNNITKRLTPTTLSNRMIMAISHCTSEELISKNPEPCHRLKIGYLPGKKARRRHGRIMGHFVEDAEANPTEFREATGDEIISEAQTVISRRLRPGAKLLSRPEMIDVFCVSISALWITKCLG